MERAARALDKRDISFASFFQHNKIRCGATTKQDLSGNISDLSIAIDMLGNRKTFELNDESADLELELVL